MRSSTSFSQSSPRSRSKGLGRWVRQRQLNAAPPPCIAWTCPRSDPSQLQTGPCCSEIHSQYCWTSGRMCRRSGKPCAPQSIEIRPRGCFSSQARRLPQDRQAIPGPAALCEFGCTRSVWPSVDWRTHSRACVGLRFPIANQRPRALRLNSSQSNGMRSTMGLDFRCRAKAASQRIDQHIETADVE